MCPCELIRFHDERNAVRVMTRPITCSKMHLASKLIPLDSLLSNAMWFIFLFIWLFLFVYTYHLLSVQYGVLEVTNHKTLQKSAVNFKACGWFGNDLHKVEGFLFDRQWVLADFWYFTSGSTWQISISSSHVFFLHCLKCLLKGTFSVCEIGLVIIIWIHCRQLKTHVHICLVSLAFYFSFVFINCYYMALLSFGQAAS